LIDEEGVDYKNISNCTGLLGNYTSLHGAGSDIWGSRDKFRFVYKELEGDFDIVTQVLEDENTDNLASAVVMIRESTEAGSKHAFMGLRAGYNWGTFKWRSTTGGDTLNLLTAAAIEVRAPYWVRIL
jgi:hypothetical protein